MEKITAMGMQNTQRQIMRQMQNMAAMGDVSLNNRGQNNVINENSFSLPEPISFSQAIKGAVDNINDLQISANDKQTAVDMGTSDDLSGTMLESQKASVAFSALVQVRNRLTTGLDEVMNTAL